MKTPRYNKLPRCSHGHLLDVFCADDGHVLSLREAKAELLDHLAQGHRLYPCSSECEGFDWQTGCPGHEQTEDNETP